MTLKHTHTQLLFYLFLKPINCQTWEGDVVSTKKENRLFRSHKYLIT